MPDPRIALCMIVRDEAAVIARCLRSVLPLIDAWVICDTGSSDGTPELIEQLLDGIPGELHRRPWRDFGTNRSELMTLAAGAAEYLLLLDADMTLRIIGTLPELTADVYMLRHDGDPAYRVPRLVRGDRRFWFEGLTHEYLATEGGLTETILEELVVEHHADGGSRADKLERDRALLQADLDRDPENPRTTFYLAGTYRDLGFDEEAIKLYLRRVELGGWEQERSYAAYQAGVLLVRRNDDRALTTLLRAWRLRPTRAEPLHDLARFCRFRGWWDAAHLFAGRGVMLACPDDALFVHRWIYQWGLHFELALAAYWIGENDQALALSESLLTNPTLPRGIDDAVREARDYCLTRNGARITRRDGTLLKDRAPSFETAEIRLDVQPSWPQFNPTVARDGEGFRMIVRTANYRLEHGRYHYLTDDETIRTLNYLLTLDQQLSVTSVAPLIEAPSDSPLYPSPVEGLEDCRLLRIGDRWLASATARDRNPRGRCQQVLLTLEQNRITEVLPLKAPIPSEHEKNWMPFTLADQLRFVYCCAPTVVLGCNTSTGVCPQIASHPAPQSLELRGGSQGLAVEEGFLFVVHEAVTLGETRTYRHRFALLDGGHRLAGISEPFDLISPGIEFCAGLAARGKQLLLSFGVADSRAMLGVLDIGEALAMLEPSDTSAEFPRVDLVEMYSSSLPDLASAHDRSTHSRR